MIIYIYTYLIKELFYFCKFIYNKGIYMYILIDYINKIKDFR